MSISSNAMDATRNLKTSHGSLAYHVLQAIFLLLICVQRQVKHIGYCDTVCSHFSSALKTSRVTMRTMQTVSKKHVSSGGNKKETCVYRLDGSHKRQAFEIFKEVEAQKAREAAQAKEQAQGWII